VAAAFEKELCESRNYGNPIASDASEPFFVEFGYALFEA
jgi:hypothetical protein